jgi:GntR family transcriptional regulator, rspAB operon transcriptional repressor
MVTPSTLTASDTIRDLIVTGKLKPNEEIDMESLCRNYSLEKQNVAEAFATLENEGFVTYSHQHPVVRKISKEEIEEWLEKRFSLELDIIEKLAKNSNDEKLAEIDELMKKQEDAYKSGSVRRFLELNSDFHFQLASQAGFPSAARWIKLQSARLKISEIKALDTQNKFRECLEEHATIVSFLKSHQPEKARDAMKVHLEKTKERIGEHFE